MSSIRLSGSSSGYYDLTVPAAAGTNSIDLSDLPVKDSNGNLGIGTNSPANFGGQTIQVNHASSYSSVLATSGSYSMQFMASQNNGVMNMGARSNHHVSITTNDIPRMTIDSSGYVRKPYQPCFDVASNQSVGQNSYQTFNTQYHNVGNHFSLANNRFTAPVDGLYQFFATTIKNTAAAGGVARVYIYVNGAVSNGNRHVRLSEGANYGTNGVGSWIISMSAGDYAQVYMGGGGNGSHSSTEYTYFNGYLLQ